MISLSVNLSDDGNVQSTKVELQWAAFLLSSRSCGEEEENTNDGMPPELPNVQTRVPRRGATGALGEEEDGNEPAAAPDKLASPQDKDSSCIRSADSALAGAGANVWAATASEDGIADMMVPPI